MNVNTKDIKYPYLPEGREILYVGEDNEFMQAAKVMQKKATDWQHPSGAVVVKDGEIVGKASLLSSLPRIRSIIRAHKSGMCLRRWFNVPSGTKYWVCPGCVHHVGHSEATAVRNALKNVDDISGADLYLYGHWWCCKPCWDSMIGAGIKGVYLLEGSEVIFNRSHEDNIIGHDFK